MRRTKIENKFQKMLGDAISRPPQHFAAAVILMNETGKIFVTQRLSVAWPTTVERRTKSMVVPRIEQFVQSDGHNPVYLPIRCKPMRGDPTHHRVYDPVEHHQMLFRKHTEELETQRVEPHFLPSFSQPGGQQKTQGPALGGQASLALPASQWRSRQIEQARQKTILSPGKSTAWIT